MRLLGLALLLGMVGTWAAAMYTIVLGFAGTPGAFIGWQVKGREPGAIRFGLSLIVTTAGQLAAALVWAAFIALTVRSWVGEANGLGKWVLWTVAFSVACAPATLALKEAAQTADKNPQHHATLFTAPLTAIGMCIMAFSPALVERWWGWVPHF